HKCLTMHSRGVYGAATRLGVTRPRGFHHFYHRLDGFYAGCEEDFATADLRAPRSHAAAQPCMVGVADRLRGHAVATGAPKPIPAVIRTPDQRVRVFISSTLGELAPERLAVKAAIERLHLTPVMFEDGARPHAPRTLYRAYLAQSHIFVGIYWQRYGWIGEGESVSGLEDEYRLAGDRPRLLYIKHPAAEREPRLTELLRQSQADGKASYKRFGSTEELVSLVERDLVLLLSERFEAAAAHPDAPAPRPRPPQPLTR